jgi:hypothetical protein
VNRGGRKVTRWNRRLLFGAMVVLVPALAGCEAGFNAPTLQYHPANFTGNEIKNGISFSNVFVLGAAPNGPAVAGGRTGVFLSLYSKNGDQLKSVSATGVASQASITGGPVSLPANSLVDLSGPVPKVVLSGLANPLQGGETVTIDFTFAKAGTISVDVPVEPQSFEFETYSPPPTPSPSPSATGKKKRAKGSASASAAASPSATP